MRAVSLYNRNTTSVKKQRKNPLTNLVEPDPIWDEKKHYERIKKKPSKDILVISD